MNASVFDPDTFLSSTTTEASSTEYVPVPEGEYLAVVTKVAARATERAKILDVTWEIDDEAVKAETGLEHPTVRQSVFLDVNEQGALETGKGKNVDLGRLREAVGQNTPGQPWSPTMLEGQVARVRVAHRMYEGRTYADVKGVAKAS